MSSRQRLFRMLYRLGFTPWDGHPLSQRLRDLVEGSGQTPALNPGRALDIGCGTGDSSIYLAQHGWQVIGVDYVKPLAKARAKAGANRVSAEFVEADVTRLSATGIGAGFDLVVDNGCLHGMSGGTGTPTSERSLPLRRRKRGSSSSPSCPARRSACPASSPPRSNAASARRGNSWPRAMRRLRITTAKTRRATTCSRAALGEIASMVASSRKPLPSAQSQREAGGVAGMVIAATAVATATNSTPMNTAVAPPVHGSRSRRAVHVAFAEYRIGDGPEHRDAHRAAQRAGEHVGPGHHTRSCQSTLDCAAMRLGNAGKAEATTSAEAERGPRTLGGDTVTRAAVPSSTRRLRTARSS